MSKNLHLNPLLFTLLAVLAFSPAGGAEPSSSLRSEQRQRSDAEIEHVLRTQLREHERYRSTAVRAEIRNGVVTLRGVAPTLPEKWRVEKAASAIRGVQRVRNLVSVPRGPRSDAEILRDVRAALRANPAVDLEEVKAGVIEGVVTLSGKVDSFAEKWIATQAAAHTPGVRAINNRLLYLYTEERPDSEILADIKGRLAWDAKVEGGEVLVSVNDGVVTLRGVVDTPLAKKWARLDAWVAGVKAVHSSELLVRPYPTGEKGEQVQMTDAAIRQAINNSFLFHPRLSMSPRVAVENGIVTLTGKVDTARERRETARVAAGIAGVRAVHNELQVSPGSTRILED